MALSALFVFRIRTEGKRPIRVEGLRLRTEIAEGLHFVVRHPLLVRITACTGLSNFAGALLRAGAFLTTYTIVVYYVMQVSFRQRLYPSALLGRMNASIRCLLWGPLPVVLSPLIGMRDLPSGLDETDAT